MDEFREREFLLHVSKSNRVWREGFESVWNLSNLEERIPEIKRTFQFRLERAQRSHQTPDTSNLLWFDDTADIIIVSPTDRIMLVNEPRKLKNALYIHEVDALSKKHDIPYSVDSIRAAYSAVFLEFIAALGARQTNNLLTKETLLLLADKEFMLRVSNRIVDMDKRRNAGKNVNALEKVQGTIAALNLSSYLPLRDNVLVLLHGLQTTGRISPQEMLDTLYSKETFFNLSPHHILQFEAITASLRKTSVPKEIVLHYEWLSQEARQLVGKTHPIQKNGINPVKIVLLDKPPSDLETPSLCLEYWD
jgi:hypothetical protein